MHIKENWTDIGFIVLMVPVLNWMIFLMHDFEEFKKYNKKPSDLKLRFSRPCIIAGSGLVQYSFTFHFATNMVWR